MNKADYLGHLNKLGNGPLIQIAKIIESEISSIEKSIKIMALLRKECIFIHHNRLHSADFSEATIKPDDVNVKLNLENEDLATEWYPIFANSFGPFYPSEYFKKENFRIVWLLKESYIMKDSWVKGDRGKHNQAKEYTVYFEENGYFDNDTHDNILKLSRTILTTLEVIDKEASDKEVLNHICILEINHFPGLAFKTTESKSKSIGEWAELNTELIKALIAFYEPNIIIGGHTLGHFFPESYRYKDSVGEKNQHDFDHISKGIYGHIIDEGNNFEVLGFSLIDSNWNKNLTPNFIFKTKENCFMIDANHPCRDNNYTENNATEDAKIIKEWLE